jgi:methylmalonyl-CoA mutase N-terminal domain/subunit
MWAKMMQSLGATDPKAMMLRFHSQTGGATLTAQQPLNNISRVTIQTLAAVLGGTQSLHTNGYDEALSLPTEEAARIALRTQQIVAYESGVADTADPLAGSYYVEWLTDEIERKANELIETIDGMGGSVSAIEQGYMQEAISNSAYQYQKKIESGEKIIVGVNQFQADKETPIPGFVIDDSIREVQSARLAEIRAKRDPAMADDCLNRIRRAAIESTNLMPEVIRAVEHQCTLGEIAGELRKVFGVYRG